MAHLYLIIILNGVSGIVAMWAATNMPQQHGIPLFIGGLLCLLVAVWLDVYVKGEIKKEDDDNE